LSFEPGKEAGFIKLVRWLKNCISTKKSNMSIPQSIQMQERDEDQNDSSTDSSPEAMEDDGTPVLDEEDLEENNLSLDEAEDIEWEEPAEEGK
jgi:hypothetical protein